MYVGRAKRGRCHPADHRWSLSKTLGEAALVHPTTELHAQAQGASLCSSIRETACHHSPSLGRNVPSAYCVCVCVFMCLNCMFMCLDVYPCISLSLFRSVCIHDFIRNVSVRVSWSMRVCVRGSHSERGRPVVRKAPAKLPGWQAEGFDILLSIMCTNNMVTCPQCVIITPK